MKANEGQAVFLPCGGSPGNPSRGPSPDIKITSTVPLYFFSSLLGRDLLGKDVANHPSGSPSFLQESVVPEVGRDPDGPPRARQPAHHLRNQPRRHQRVRVDRHDRRRQVNECRIDIMEVERLRKDREGPPVEAPTEIPPPEPLSTSPQRSGDFPLPRSGQIRTASRIPPACGRWSWRVHVREPGPRTPAPRRRPTRRSGAGGPRRPVAMG